MFSFAEKKLCAPSPKLSVIKKILLLFGVLTKYEQKNYISKKPPSSLKHSHTRTTVKENRLRHSNFLSCEMQFIFELDITRSSPGISIFFRCNTHRTLGFKRSSKRELFPNNPPIFFVNFYLFLSQLVAVFTYKLRIFKISLKRGLKVQESGLDLDLFLRKYTFSRVEKGKEFRWVSNTRATIWA
jgi:hypothetical protein